MRRTTNTRRASQTGCRVGVGFLALCLLVAAPRAAWPEGLDLCGCKDDTSPSNYFGVFDTGDPGTFPPGSVHGPGVDGNHFEITIPVPPSGILIFDSVHIGNYKDKGKRSHVKFISEGNAPVRILVKGDFESLGLAHSYYGSIFLDGSNGGTGVIDRAGQGGAPALGGYAGGDGAFLAGNSTHHGGAGIGPGGGLGGNAPEAGSPEPAEGGTFYGVEQLRPLVGGSGGGGGYSSGDTNACAAGGGGGGGGALQIVVNGTMNIGGQIFARGGAGGSPAGSECAGAGAGGSGGAILLIADTIKGGGEVSTAGGSSDAEAGSDGRIRMEAITNTYTGSTTPTANTFSAPGPAVAAATPSVAITHVTGANMSLEESLPPEFPQGFNGEIDLIVPQAGTVTFSFETQRVPSGTELELAVKPSVGGDPKQERVTLGAEDCSAGICNVDLAIDLDPGAYVAEARATFEVPSSP